MPRTDTPDVLIHSASIITMDAERSLHSDGAVAIHQGRIIDLGASSALRSRYQQAKETIDASNMLLMPGWINAHTHIAMALFRGLYAGDPGSIYSVMFPVEEALDAEAAYDLGMLGAIECLKGGATTIVDHYYFMDQIALAVERIGLRGVLGHTVADRLAPFTGEAERARAIDFLDKWQAKSPRITPVLAPHSPETVTVETFSELSAVARDRDVLLHLHLAQSPHEVESIRREYGMSPVEFLEHHGLLSGRLLAAHAVFVNESDIERLAAHDVSVVFCPTSQVSYLHRDVTPTPELHSRGVRVVLGTDAAAGTGNMSILGEPRTAAMVQLLRFGADGRLSPQTLLGMVTIEAARAIGLQHEVGSLEVGKRADVILLDLQNAELAPMNDPYFIAIYGMTEPNIDTIMVDGKVVYSDGTVAGVDEQAAVGKAHEVRTAVLERAIIRHPRLSESLTWRRAG